MNVAAKFRDDLNPEQNATTFLFDNLRLRRPSRYALRRRTNTSKSLTNVNAKRRGGYDADDTSTVMPLVDDAAGFRRDKMMSVTANDKGKLPEDDDPGRSNLMIVNRFNGAGIHERRPDRIRRRSVQSRRAVRDRPNNTENEQLPGTKNGDVETRLKRDEKFTDNPVRKQEVATKNRDSSRLNSINFETTVTSSSGVFPTNAAFDKRPAKGKAKSIEKDLTLISNVLLKMNKSLQRQQGDAIDKQPDFSRGSTLPASTTPELPIGFEKKLQSIETGLKNVADAVAIKGKTAGAAMYAVPSQAVAADKANAAGLLTLASKIDDVQRKYSEHQKDILDVRRKISQLGDVFVDMKKITPPTSPDEVAFGTLLLRRVDDRLIVVRPWDVGEAGRALDGAFRATKHSPVTQNRPGQREDDERRIAEIAGAFGIGVYLARSVYNAVFRVLPMVPGKSIWTHWDLWSACSASCVPGGRRTRRRLCVATVGRDCDGEYRQTASCNGDIDCSGMYDCAESVYLNV